MRAERDGPRPPRRSASSSDLKLNPHLHVVFLDGVYIAAPDGELVFRALPHLSTSDVADALQIARARILRHLGRRGVVRVGDDALFCVDDELAERAPALAQLARAAVSGLAPAGPELCRRPVELAFEARPGVVITAPLSVREHGFSLHAATRAGAADARGREALLGFVLRPPVATERVVAGPDGLVRVVLKRPFSDGTRVNHASGRSSACAPFLDASAAPQPYAVAPEPRPPRGFALAASNPYQSGDIAGAFEWLTRSGCAA